MYLDIGTLVATMIALVSSIAVIALLLRDNICLRNERNLLEAVIAHTESKSRVRG